MQLLQEKKYPEKSRVIGYNLMAFFNLNKVGGVMFGFTKRHEQDWRLTRLEEK